MNSKIRPLLQKIMVLLVVLGGMVAGWKNLQFTKTLGQLQDDPVTQWEKRFVVLKGLIPFKRGVVGYLSDSGVPGVDYAAANDLGEYTLTQYTLSPVILVRGTNQEWIVGNLSKQAYAVWSRSNQGQFEVTPLNYGLYLIHRLDR